MRKITVNVTQEDIDNGEPDDCSECPVALAIWRELPLFRGVRVNRDGIYLVDMDNRVYERDFPHGVLNFIGLFDEGGYVEPFSFELDLEPSDSCPT